VPLLTDTEKNITGLFKAVKDVGVNYFYVDKLNLRYGGWPDLLKLLKAHYPALIPKYRKILFEQAAKEAYRANLSATIHAIAIKLGLESKLDGII
jgi:hypothetical protein